MAEIKAAALATASAPITTADPCVLDSPALLAARSTIENLTRELEITKTRLLKVERQRDNLAAGRILEVASRE